MCLLTTYKEDFQDPPRYSTLVYLMKHIPDREIQTQCRTLLEKFKLEDENGFSSTSPDGNTIRRGLDYILPWNLQDMSSSMVAEQFTIVDAVSSM